MPSGLSQMARSALPRPVVERLGRLAAARQRAVLERRLPGAVAAFDAAYGEYWRTGIVPDDADELLFLAAWSSGGLAPAEAMARSAPAYSSDRYSPLSDDLLRSVDPERVAAEVARAGFTVLPDLLDAEAVDDIRTVLERGPAQPRGDGMHDRKAGPPRPDAPSWWMRPQQTLASASARQVLRQRALADTAGRYLGVEPMIMSVVLWKSFSWRTADRSSAQLFHYDNDRPGFLKFFVYLTDVDDSNGPHTYVEGSHLAKPRHLLHGGRLSDDEVAAAYPRETWRVITGPKGTMFFADTRGFHKGGAVASGERAMFQVNLASDRFGIDEPAIGGPDEAPADLRPLVDRLPRYFAQLYTPATPAP
jgi:hypothetical protein